METRTHTITIALLVALVLGLGAWLFWIGREETSGPFVRNFEECVAAYPVMESFPRQGRTPNGTVFVEKVQNGDGDAEDNMIRVTSPRPNETVTSPLRITGEARGTWYFEASFPVRLEDLGGRVLAEGPAQAQGEWMTEEFVPFVSELSFTVTTPTQAVLVLEKDNPFGLPEYADERRVSIMLEPASPVLRTVLLAYYNPEKDKDASGAILCSRQGIVTVEREIPSSQTPLRDTITLLMKGELTPAERAAGISTEFPLSGFSLESAAIMENGTAVLTFRDPLHKTSGGSCRVAVLWYQIEETAKQFAAVERVESRPPTLFQP